MEPVTQAVGSRVKKDTEKSEDAKIRTFCRDILQVQVQPFYTQILISKFISMQMAGIQPHTYTFALEGVSLHSRKH